MKSLHNSAPGQRAQNAQEETTALLDMHAQADCAMMHLPMLLCKNGCKAGLWRRVAYKLAIKMFLAQDCCQVACICPVEYLETFLHLEEHVFTNNQC